MTKLRKPQLHSDHFKTWNYRGTDNFSAFSPSDVLASDAWRCSASTNVLLDSDQVTIRPSDVVMAMVDNPSALSLASINDGSWRIFRNFSEDELQAIADLTYVPPGNPIITLNVASQLEKNFQAGDVSTIVSYDVTKGSKVATVARIMVKRGTADWAVLRDVLTAYNALEQGADLDDTYDTTITMNETTQFKFELEDEDGPVTSVTRTVSFILKTFDRIDVAEPTLNSTWLNAGNGVLDANAYRSFSLTTGAGQHMFYAVPESYISGSSPSYIEPPYFAWGVVTGGFEVVDKNVVRTLGDGVTTERYIVFRSEQANLGPIQITVQSTM